MSKPKQIKAGVGTVSGRVAALVGLIASSMAQSAIADEWHYNNVIIGDRAAGLAGAYTAISEDPSGLYYNPAGAVFSAGRNLSASVNAYQETNTHYKKVLAGNGYHRRSTAILPNFFGVMQPVGKAVVGFSYAVPDSSQEDQEQTFYNMPSTITDVTIDRYVINYNNKDNTFLLGPSVAYPISPNLSIGGTLYAHYRQREYTLNQLLTLSNGMYEWTNANREDTEWGINPILGVLWSPHDKVGVGLSVSKTQVQSSDAKAQVIAKKTAYDGNTVDYLFVQSQEHREHPLKMRLGVAYFYSSSLLVSADLNHFSATDDEIDGKKEAVTNIALGTEYYLSDRIALRAGYFTNNANTPDLVAGNVGQREHIDMQGATLSVSRFVGNTSMTLGTAYSYGEGDAQIVPGPAIQPVERETWTVYISAGYSY